MRLVERVTARGVEVHPVTPPRLFAATPTWRQRSTWLAAGRAHPRLGEAARRRGTATARVVQVQELLAGYADAATGRDIAVSHGQIARQLGVCTKVIQRACWALEDLGLLVRVLDGADMTLGMRMQLRDAYPRGDKRGTRSKLPTVYAATLPRWLAMHLTRTVRPKPTRGSVYGRLPTTPGVDNSSAVAAPQYGRVHPPVGGPRPSESSDRSYLKTTTFTPDLGITRADGIRTTKSEAAPRPHQQEGPRTTRSRLNPEVEGWCRALRASLPGYRAVSLHRIAPALTMYVRAGLSTTDVIRGLNNWLAATSTSWLTLWQDDQTADQARYLIAMIRHARQAGYIRPT